MLYPSPTTHSNNSTSSSNLEALKNKVFEKRPTLRTIFEQYGNTPLANFTPDQFVFSKNTAIPQERKTELISAVTNIVEEKLGKQVAESVSRQLEENYFVTTAYHHGPINYPGYLGSNILTSLYMKNRKSSTLENIIMLSCANISFDNSYNFSRGLYLHDVVNGQEFSNQLVFFPRKVRPYPVVYHPAYTQDSLTEMYGRLDAWTNKEFAIQKHNADKLRALVKELFDTESMLSEKTFSDQTTRANYLLWKKLFSDINLVDIEQEEIVIELLEKYHLQQNTLIHRMLFTPEYTEKILELFDGVQSAFSTTTQTNSFLFWAFPNNQRSRVQLWKQGNILTTADGAYSIPLTPEAIAEGFKNHELVPSTLLSFMVLTFYYGLNLIGGMSQTSYLPKMQEVFIKLLTEIGETEDIPQIKQLESTRQNFTRCDLVFLDNSLGSTTLASTIDLLLYANSDFLTTIETMTQTVTIEQLLSRSLIELYRMVTPQDQQEEGLLAVTKEEIDQATGYNKKIQFAGKIS